MNFKNKKYLLLLLFSIFINSSIYSQNKKYNQFWNEISINGTFDKKWSTEFEYRGKYSSELGSSNPFYSNIQRSYTLWAHYYGGPRWKFSGGIGYFDNNNASNIGSVTSPQWRFTAQSTYIIHKIGYTLSTRMRLEAIDAKIPHEDYGLQYRYRQQLKYLQPINSTILSKGVYYGFISDEIFLQSDSKNSGVQFFNRNRFNIGAGYLITDDLQLEASYLNEFQPKDNYNTILNIYSIRIKYTNLDKKILQLCKEKTPSKEQDEIIKAK